MVRPTRQANLVFGSQADLELALDSADDDGVQVELCDVHHARRTGAGVIATVGTEFQVFFRLSGDVETRAAVRVRPATRAAEVIAATTTERFQVMLRARPLTTATAMTGAGAMAVAAPVAGTEASPASAAPAGSTRPARTAAPLLAPSWLDALPPGVRDVFRHLAEHGTINEAEAIGLLGGPRPFRTFSVNFEQYVKQAPFVVHVEMASGGKCYKRGEPEGV